MRKLLLALLFASPAYADVIPITQAVTFTVPQNKIAVPLQGEIDFFSSALNGTSVNGQQVSLDLMLADGVLLRTQIYREMWFGIRVFTTAGPFLGGEASNISAYFIDSEGGHVLVRWAGGGGLWNDGSFHAGAFSLDYPTLTPVLFTGVHFDMTLPDSDALITNTRLRFIVPQAKVEFGTVAQLPEGSSLGMLLVGILGCSIGWGFTRYGARGASAGR